MVDLGQPMLDRLSDAGHVTAPLLFSRGWQVSGGVNAHRDLSQAARQDPAQQCTTAGAPLGHLARHQRGEVSSRGSLREGYG